MSRIIYAGTPEFAVPALDALLRAGHDVVAVYTQPDRPAGRGRKLQPGPVKQRAEAAGIAIEQPRDFSDPADIERLRQYGADLMVVAAYGLLLPGEVLAIPRLGCVNIHASLLPRWRGASPIQQAILAGDERSGVCLMRMDEGLDTGDVIMRRECVIDAGWSAGDLHDVLAPLGAEILLEALDDIESRLQQATPQPKAGVTYAPRLDKQQARVDWRKSAVELDREVRAYNPWPVSFTRFEGDNLRLWRACVGESSGTVEAGRVIAHDRDGVYIGCAEGVLRVTELQFPGRRRCTAAEALNGHDLSGCQLGD